jgi:tripartite ATP-independent transporter DctP family solute receptor
MQFNFKRISKFVGMACMCVPLLLNAAEYKKEYRLSVVPGPSSGWAMTAEYFAELVKEKSQGRINIKVYPAAQLMSGKQTSEFMLLRNGAIDFSLSSTINWSPQIKELNLPAMPFMIASEPNRFKAMDAILSGKSGKMMIDAVEKKGVKFLGFGENGFRELTTSKGPIKTPEDMQGLKIRVVGSPIFIDTFKALGANPVNMNWSEATTGFQQGLVDGQENPTNGININLRIWDYHKYYTDWHYIIDPLLLCANKKIYDDFSKEDQELLVECAHEMEKYGKALSRMGMDDGSSLAFLKSINKTLPFEDPYKELEAHGMQVEKFTPQMIKVFYDATAKVREDWSQKLGQDLMNAAQKDMESVR